MKYSTPEIVVLGPAATLVLGQPPGEGDNPNPQFEDPATGVVLGLDD
jgi:hypothetical protein